MIRKPDNNDSSVSKIRKMEIENPPLQIVTDSQDFPTQLPNIFIDTHTGYKFKRVGQLAELLSQPNLMQHICSFIQFDVQLRLKLREISTTFYDFIEEFMRNCHIDMKIVSKAMKHFELFGRRQVPQLLSTLLPPINIEELYVLIPLNINRVHLSWLVEQHADRLTFLFAVPGKNNDKKARYIRLINAPSFSVMAFKQYTFEWLALSGAFEISEVTELSLLRVSTLEVNLKDNEDFTDFQDVNVKELLIAAHFAVLHNRKYIAGLDKVRGLKRLKLNMDHCDRECVLKNEDKLKDLKIPDLDVTVVCEDHGLTWHHP
jgi:hypothetical protein